MLLARMNFSVKSFATLLAQNLEDMVSILKTTTMNSQFNTVTKIDPALHHFSSSQGHLCSSGRHRASLSINLSFDVQHQQQPLKKRVLTVLIVRAEVGLPASCDGCPESTQHTASDSTVHQVVPGGHVEETVQGELVRE